MSKGINKDEFELYLSGMSIPEVHAATSIPLSTLRFRFKKAGILRSRNEGIRLAAKKGKLSTLKGVPRTFSEQWKKNISIGKKRQGDKSADSTSLKQSGYMEFTRGKNKGRSVHIVVMENHLGRRLTDGECVHHIDRNKTNNSLDNLALMTRSAHARLHRFEDKLEGKFRRRNANGTWS